jgi:hypothetical protein
VFGVTIAVSVLLAALLTWSARAKLSHSPEVVASYGRVGVPERRLNALATVLLAGAAGVLVGLAFAPVGVAAAGLLVVYFLLAAGFHIRYHDAARLPTPLAFALLAGAVLTLRLLTW